MSGPPCSVCGHPRRSEIDSDNRGYIRTAKAWGIAPSSLQRHRKHAERPIAPPRAKRVDRPLAIQVAPIDARTVAIETLAALREAMREADPEDVPSFANACTSAARLLARLSGQLEISQTQIVRSLPWRNLMELLDGVLAKHPAAAKEWAAVLGTVDA